MPLGVAHPFSLRVLQTLDEMAKGMPVGRGDEPISHPTNNFWALRVFAPRFRAVIARALRNCRNMAESQ